MKKITLSLAVMAIAAASCQKPETDIPVAEQFTATVESFDSPTKTSMTPEKYVIWSQNDRLAIFQGGTVAYEYKVNEASAGTANGTFSRVIEAGGNDFVAGTELPCNVAFYPYAAGLTLTGAALEDKGAAYSIEGVVLPAEQTYSAGSFGNGSFPMAAVTENLEDHILIFKNVLGALKLQLKGTQTVKSIKVTGKNNEALSGTAVVTAYTNNLAPAITMTSTDEASKSVTLNCGDGIQLNDGTATEFIISLPPVLFTQGFTVTVTDSNDETYTVETDKANTVLRSSILTMPAFTLGQTPGDDTEDDDATYIEYLFLDKTSLTMYPETSYTLVADIDPVEVTYSALTWSSSNNAVAIVDQTGKITTVSDGTATITALAVGGVSATCTVIVKSATATAVKDYIVDGQNYGPGIKIGQTIWAPVNCGYEPATADYKGYPYGKLYQWGRKYGQGYGYQDASFPSGDNLVSEPVMPFDGQSVENADKFYRSSASPYDWSKVQKDDFWNDGTEDNPIKTQYDPCPNGWRVPTYKELIELDTDNYKYTSESESILFSGDYDFIDGVPYVELPLAGQRQYNNVNVLSTFRYSYGAYWSSAAGYLLGRETISAGCFSLSSTYVVCSTNERGWGSSVRCVQIIN